ncbi:MAG: hypothetical protein R3F49_06945 [Planctomycetota bacterium]
MTPTDIGITAGAVLLLIYAARTMFSKQGQAQLGCSFAVAAAFLWSIALGRRIPDFTYQDGARLGLGALLLLPAFRALFQHGKGSVVSGALGLVMASIIAGPVVQRYLDRAGLLQGPRTVQQQLTATDAEIDRIDALRKQVGAEMETRRMQVAQKGHADAEAFAADADAVELMREYAGFEARMSDLKARLEALRAERNKLAAAIEEGSESMTETELDRIRREVKEAADTGDKSMLERFSEQQQLKDLFKREFPGSAEQGAPGRD